MIGQEDADRDRRIFERGRRSHDVVGECPMGCGRTLFVGEGGYVTCSWRACPNPAAASELLEHPPAPGFRENLLTLLHAFADVPEAVRVLKIGEEFGEASEAYIGLRALNPRKGETHTHEEVASELADVAITALVAAGAFCADPIQVLTLRMSRVARRASS